MTKGEAKTMGTPGLVALFLTTFLYMADLVFYPSYGAMVQAFPEASTAIMNFCMMGSQLTAMIASFLVMPAMTKFSKRDILLFETLLFGVSALCAPLVHDVLYVTVMRTISGLGFGGVLGVSGALIQQVYADDPARRDRYIGLYNSALGLAGAIGSLAGGLLATISWDAIYRFYWIVVPIFILEFLFLPKTLPDGEEATQEGSQGEPADASEDARGQSGWNGTLPSVLACALSYLFVNIIYVGMASGELSLFVVELGLGGEAESGVLMMVAALMAVPCGIAFPSIYHKFGRWTASLFYAVMAIGLLLYCFPSNIFVLGLAIACVSFAYSMGLAYYMIYAGEVAPPAKASSAISLVTIGMALGAFASPFVVTAIQEMLGTTSLLPVYPVLLVATLAGLLMCIVLARRATRNQGEKVAGKA